MQKKRKPKKLKITVSPATAIAAANAAVKYLRLGTFISEYQSILDKSPCFTRYGQTTGIEIRGRTNADEWVCVETFLVFKEDYDARGPFPFAKVAMIVHRTVGDSNGVRDVVSYLEYVFLGGIFQIARIEKSPYVPISTVSDME